MAFHDLAVDLDPSVTPGALADQRERSVPGLGRVRFEQAPAGWLTKDGERRQRDHRAYYFTPDPDRCVECDGRGRDYSRSVRGRKCSTCGGTGITPTDRLTSVTTLIGQITPKDGLPPWYEARGIEGAVEAIRLGIIDVADLDSAMMAVDLVRAHRLGADRASKDAADRGLDIHDCLEQFMHDGIVREPSQPEHHGYWLALTRWLDAYSIEPEEVERLVASPDDGYAGRLDLVGRRAGERILFDAKTQQNGGIYPGAHLQVQLLERARRVMGDQAADRLVVVVFAADGQWREMDGHADGELVEAALAYSRLLKRVTSACESANRRERKAREVIA